jgi:hypothetical protein
MEWKARKGIHTGGKYCLRSERNRSGEDRKRFTYIPKTNIFVY